MANKILFCLLLLSILLSGCSIPATRATETKLVPDGAILAADIFSAPVGKQWDMVNDSGDVTHFAVEAAPENDACEDAGTHVAIHITKTMARAYWGVGFDGAEDRFNISIDADGSYRGIADISQNVNGLDMITVNWRPISGLPSPYMILPPYFVRGETQTISTFYHGYLLRHVNTNQCVAGNEDVGQIDWKSSFYESTVDTPVYKGWAIVSEQWENCVQFPPECGAHEKWYFVPGVGLVEIDSAVTTIKRIN